MKINTVKALILSLSCVWGAEVLAQSSTEKVQPGTGRTMTQEKQQNMTPKQALLRLKEGNKRFLTNTMIARDYRKQAKISSYGQFPFAVVLNCMDSRSVPELFFDQGLADLFTLRVAGNVLNDDILGSMEFATKVVGAPLIVVLAHTSCGAAAGACDDVKLGHLTGLLDKMKPAVEPAMKDTDTKQCSKPELVNAIARQNALLVARAISDQSPIIKELIESKKVGLVAGMHDIKTGEVQFFEEERLIP